MNFGTGYSSLSYLKHLPVSRLLAKNLGLQGIAEGVETEEQLAFLRAKGSEEVQGFLFAPPAPADELLRYFDGAPFGAAGSA